ncbi:UvrD-helicase domain-containing protein [Streptomyces echinatus]|uniref:UvrD-helicase domain-containing protein n=1 Tax=Streptomyces echinatus TaxID=67293 RepID=UPI0031EF5DD1
MRAGRSVHGQDPGDHHRIAYGVRAGILHPASVLAVTFTNRAAEKMRGRLRQLGARASRPHLPLRRAASAPVLLAESVSVAPCPGSSTEDPVSSPTRPPRSAPASTE